MMGACRRMGVWAGVGMSAMVVAIPACLVAMGCMWVMGILCVMKVGVRLMWKPRMGAMEEEERKQKKEKKRRRSDGTQEEMRLSLFHQYLDDQLNTLGDRLAHQLLHVCRSDSLPHPPPLDVDSSDWPARHVDEQDCLHIKEGETDQPMLCL